MVVCDVWSEVPATAPDFAKLFGAKNALETAAAMATPFATRCSKSP